MISPPNTLRDVVHELPRPYPPPYTDDESAGVLDDAVETLGIIRSLGWFRYPAIELHLLASLAAQTRRALSEAVAAARDEDMSWDDIARLAGISTATARRLAVTATARRQPLTVD